MSETSIKNPTLIQNNSNNVSFKNNIQESSTNNNSPLVSSNNNNNNNSNNNGPKHHFRHHNIISHNQFIKQDVKEVSLLDSLKSSIVDDSPIRKSNYVPEKVYVRTDLCLLTGDQQEILKEKERRKKNIMECGFSSVFKEPYKPLGVPIIDTNALIIDCLKINPSSFQKSTHNKISKMNNLKHELNHVNRKIPVLELTGRQTGYKLLKSALKESTTRMHSVKYGVPFFETMKNQDKYNYYKESDKNDRDLNTIDYKHLVFDTDKQNYFTHLVNIRKKELYNESLQSYSEKLKNNNEKKKKSKKEDNDELNLKNIHLKKLEESLQFKQNPNINPIGKFYETRDGYYEQRQRLNNILEEDLNRLEFNRSKIFRKKFCALTISKNNGFADDDLKRMRSIVNKELRIEREKVINRHPWYNDMVNKMIYTTGTARQLTETENILFKQIKNIIEDGIPFSRLTYINILKIIPPSEFMTENIQRMLRFIKQHEPIAERDYMEAVEASGHSMKINNPNDDDNEDNENNSSENGNDEENENNNRNNNNDDNNINNENLNIVKEPSE
ncbi:hypothetical protein BCR36DRAFT_363932 [Piromyces finnis]|uniref:Uncharacterized protein n=1 Tax=Piromyces finnis TaxID=1754191 RepID=A0A1Y1UUM5_9FUNG|nr:hypothetical protein BCR36DRAFT_363932 [Piromyces finnis]|eukprot:ORX41667.1 hypothetical protein BCR36DRAFT_363932 [Piromyces finnis]